MRSSPEVKVKISPTAGRSCAGAPWGPCSSQGGAATVGLSVLAPKFLLGLRDLLEKVIVALKDAESFGTI